jgi:CubicO group peptidase (beta-lactamase class C family)
MKIDQRPGTPYPPSSASSRSTPSDRWQWPQISATAARMNPQGLARALEIAEAGGSDSLLVLRSGRIVLEQYWHDRSADDLQQTYSGTKSLFSLLVGRAISKGYLDDLDHPIQDLIPELPVAFTQLTFRNIMAMESGVANSPEIEAMGQTGQTQFDIAISREVTRPPFQYYHYNNAPYRLLFTALERASDRSLEALTIEEVFEPLDFNGAYWVRLYAVDEAASGNDAERFTGYQSIRMTPSDFAKSSQIIIDDGLWQGRRYLPAAYTRALVAAPSPEANPSFGLFHHLNAGDHYHDFAWPDRIERKLVPGAPDDTFLMFGSGGQVTVGIPSRQLVIVRTGPNHGSIYEADNYIARLIRQVADAAA